MQMTAREIAEACGGVLLCGNENTVVTSVSTDSRRISAGALFVPLKGERTDAHMYIDAVFSAGAAATLTQNDTKKLDVHPWISVPNTEVALQKIASAYRSRFHIPVVGITGSVGKTTTKEMVALALSSSYRVMKTEGNQNSQVGLPLTLFRLEEGDEAAVIEMGMSDFGEMSRLCSMARPKYAVMTNIGISHIQQLKTQENILKEKLHITDCFGTDSILFLNGQDPFLASLREKLPHIRKVYFGTEPWCEYRAQEIESTEKGVRFRMIANGISVCVELPVHGFHNVLNALAGLSVTHSLGGDVFAASRALSQYEPPAMRQQIHKVRGITLIDDSYNASPDALRSSLHVLGSFSGRKIAVLADMLELGEFEEAAHRQVGKMAADAGVDLLVTIGERARWIAEEAKACHIRDCVSFSENSETASYLKEIVKEGDVLLVKGSRSMHTDEIVRAFL
ncbi:MAG: UDP-N-acetylmuramoyl-tripeptide--D-alanyl-D-alanine ligase [Hydrogeniiclostridium sp.]